MFCYVAQLQELCNAVYPCICIYATNVVNSDNFVAYVAYAS